MPYAFSRISDSVILDLVCAGEMAFAVFEFEEEPASARVLGESNRFDHGGIARLLIADCSSLQEAHWLMRGH